MKRTKSLFPAAALLVAALGWGCEGMNTITGVDDHTQPQFRQVGEEEVARCPEGWEDDLRYPAVVKPCVEP